MKLIIGFSGTTKLKGGQTIKGYISCFLLASFSLGLIYLPVPAAEREARAEQELEFPTTFVTRGPTVATELKLHFSSAKPVGEDRELAWVLESSWAFSERYQVLLSIPYLRLNLAEGDIADGLGDVGAEAQYIIWQSKEHFFVLTGGVGLGIPTGSARRGAGGLFELVPFFLVGKGFDKFTIQGEVGLALELNRIGQERKQQGFIYNIALAYSLLNGRLSPMLELVGDHQLHRLTNQDGTHLALLPGLRFKPSESIDVGLGYRIPLTKKKDAFHAIFFSLAYSF